jgi:hypothetical protein
LVDASSFPFGLTATESVRRAPVANGEPLLGQRAIRPAENTRHRAEKIFAEVEAVGGYEQTIGTECQRVQEGAPPVLNGEPLTCVNGADAHAPDAAANKPTTTNTATATSRQHLTGSPQLGQFC